MELDLMTRLRHSWNAFMNRDPTSDFTRDPGPSYSYRPDRVRPNRGNEKSIINAIYNRIALDVAAIDIRHCRTDSEGRFVEEMNTTLNDRLGFEANIDQTSRAFFQDVVMSMLDEGSVAIIPVDTNIDPSESESYKINELRTGQILEWKPTSVRVRVYNERTGVREDIWCEKKYIAIIENPMYAVMNEPNSTMQRLIRKLNLLDAVDEQSSAGKLDLIIQLPYVIKSEARRREAEKRRKDIEDQLSGSKYGIAYADGTERIVQLNRPIENNLMKQIEYLTNLVFSQLSMTQSILDGSASEQELLNYNTRLVEPIISAIVDEMNRKFLTKTARTQKQTIRFFRDPFKLVPINTIADVAGTLLQQEVVTANEVRQFIGMKPSTDPKADQLVNSNINQTGTGLNPTPDISEEDIPPEEEPSLGDKSISDL